MDSLLIIDYLEDNNLVEVEEIKKIRDYVLIKFYYDFDKDELNVVKSYLNDESDFELESDEWFNEYYILYLKDIVVDNVEFIIEEIMDEFEIEGKYKEFGMENGDNEYFKFIVVFLVELDDFELDDILNDYYK